MKKRVVAGGRMVADNGGKNMICRSCNYDNKEGAAFCAQCGKALTPETPEVNASEMKPMEPKGTDEKTVSLDEAFGTDNKQNQTVAKPEENHVGAQPEQSAGADAEEERTTVLTSDMISSASSVGTVPMGNPTVAPMGMPMGAPMGMPSGAPMGMPAGAPMGMPAGAPVNPGVAPGNGRGPVGNGQPMGMPMGTPAKPQKQQKAPKPPKAAKAPKPPKQKNKKSGKGTKVYIVISIILLLAFAGVGVWGFFYFNDKIDKINLEKDDLIAQMDASNGNYESQIADKDSEIAALESKVDEYESEIASYDDKIADYEKTNELYAAYDGLINFAGSCAGQGYADFFASDTVLHLGNGKVPVKIFFKVEESGNVIYEVENSAVATCEWDESWDGDVATLYVSPVGSGNTTITLSNDVNGETIKIYVYVD